MKGASRQSGESLRSETAGTSKPPTNSAKTFNTSCFQIYKSKSKIYFFVDAKNAINLIEACFDILKS